jgi:regulatory protein
MIITRIAKMGKDDKFAVFVDDILAITLNGQSILDSGLVIGKEVSKDEVDSLNKRADSDKLYGQALKYISLRIRSEGELVQYLKRKGASKIQIAPILAKLKNLDLINDDNYVRAYVHDRMLASPLSKRKISYELRKKQVAEEVIERSLENNELSDKDSLIKMIEIKRRQSKFNDDLKLMQYLVRNGFNYGDIKEAL